MRALLFLAILSACGDDTTMMATDDAGADAGGPRPDLYGVAAPDFYGVAGVDLASSGSGYLFPAVWVILMENHNRTQITSSASAVTIKSLASTYATAGNYHTTFNPSLPNYAEIACGCRSAHSALLAGDVEAGVVRSTVGLFSDPSLGGQLEGAGVPWRAYAHDSLNTVTNCDLTAGGEYVSRHVPFLYFKDLVGSSTTTVSAACTNRVRVFGDPTAKTGDFYTDLAAGTYAYQWITPDLIADMHDGTIANGDAFLAKVVPEIQKSAAYQAGGVIFITWDEGASGDNQIMFIAVSNRAKMGFTATTSYTHANFLATIEDIYKLPRIGSAVGVGNMLELFQ